MSQLTEAVRIANNKMNFNHQFGRPEDGDYSQAEAWMQSQMEADRKKLDQESQAR